MKQILAILLILAAFTACNLQPDGANGSRVVSGTITVFDETYWPWIRIGIFSGGDAGAYPELMTDDDSLGVDNYRIIYWDQNDGPAKPLSPKGGTAYTISGSGATERSYTFELPATLPPEDEYFYYAAWYDRDGNGLLDLADHWPMNPTDLVDCEHNRCATKDIVDDGGTPVTIAIDSFCRTVDPFTGDTGYKYIGYDDDAYNEMMGLDSSTDSGFNFAITASSGW